MAFVARYSSGRCATCRHPIHAGDQIVRYGRPPKHEHAYCFNRSVSILTAKLDLRGEEYRKRIDREMAELRQEATVMFATGV